MKRSLIYMGVGAGLMYLLDPEKGQARREMLMDKLQGTLPQTQEALTSKASEVAARASELRDTVDSVAADKIEHLADEKLGGAEKGSGGKSS